MVSGEAGEKSHNQQTDDVRPLIVQTEDGTIVDVVRMNGKSYRKSLEHGSIWFVHETGRVLPYSGVTSFLRLAEGAGWFLLTVAPDAVSLSETAPSGGSRQEEEIPSAAKEIAGTAAAPAPAPAGEAAVAGEDVPAAGAEVLSQLAEVLRKRKQELPEGSYTSYLFKSGGEKIRKKTGEEAVELILAREREEIVYESADLVYHMMVLLEEEGIPLEEIFTELKKRVK